MSIKVGDTAPDFTLQGTGSREYRLSDYLGQPVVIVFYPGDATPVCTKQLNSYNDELAAFDVDRAVLEQRIATPEVKAALAFQIDRGKRLEER